MDLTDRGVEGREPPKPLDVFLTTERGIYRVGETVYATALVRDATARGRRRRAAHRDRHPPRRQGAQPHRARRPGARRQRHAGQPARNAMRGTWRIGVYADVEGRAARRDDLPGRGFRAGAARLRPRAATAEALDPSAPAELGVDARFLYGAPAADLNVEGETLLKPVRDLAAYAGLRLRPRRRAVQRRRPSRSPARTTDEAGHADRRGRAARHRRSRAVPLEATVNVRVLDTSGRPVERNLDAAGAADERPPRHQAALRRRRRRERPGRLRADRASIRDGARVAERRTSPGRSTRSTPTSSGTAPTAAGTTRRSRRKTPRRQRHGRHRRRPAGAHRGRGRMGQLSARGREPGRRRAAGELSISRPAGMSRRRRSTRRRR